MIDIAKETMAHVKRLCVDIGHRPVGSPGNEAAAQYIEDVFLDAGLAVERQVFTCPGWDHVETVLELAGHRLEASANWRTLPCDVTGMIVPIGTLDVLARADLAGKIVLLHGELTQDELSPRASTVYYPERHRKTNDLLDQKSPAAVITVNPFPHSIRQVIKDPEMEIPSATVSPEVGLALMRHVGEPVRLHIVATRSVGQSWNEIGKRPGVRPERIVLCAHYDTVWGSPGAFDNASGVGVMLTLAQVFANQALPVGLEFVAFSAEEFGGQGADTYIAAYGLKHFPFQWDRPVGERSEVWKPILAAINADGVGLELGANNITTIAASKKFDDLVNAIRSEKYPGVVRVDPWPASDHYTFYSHGVPSIALGCTGGVTNIHHQPIDTIKWISPVKLAEVVSLVVAIVETLQDKTSEWCRPKED
jgi:aminopeptidase YwaD